MKINNINCNNSLNFGHVGQGRELVVRNSANLTTAAKEIKNWSEMQGIFENFVESVNASIERNQNHYDNEIEMLDDSYKHIELKIKEHKAFAKEELRKAEQRAKEAEELAEKFRRKRAMEEEWARIEANAFNMIVYGTSEAVWPGVGVESPSQGSQDYHMSHDELNTYLYWHPGAYTYY